MPYRILKTQTPKYKNISNYTVLKSLICAFNFLFLSFSIASATDWTVMVYMCGDNSMNDQSYVDLNEMMIVGSTEKVKIVVQVDNISSNIEPGCRRYLIMNGRKELLQDLGEVDMADPQTLINFVQFVNSYYNADKYLLILWDHGNGWPIGYYGATDEKGIIYDQSSNNWIGVADGELKYAVSEIKKILRKKISILGFDACLMAMAEVASEISNDVEIMFASEEVTPWDGLPYNDILSVLVTQPNISSQALAKQMVELSTNSYNNGSQGYQPVTFSAIDLKKYLKAQDYFADVCNMLSRYANSTLLTEARNTVQTFSIESYHNPPPTFRDDYIDLIDFLEKVKPIINVQTDRQKLLKAIEYFSKAVLENKYVGFYLSNAKGLSVWFPDNYIAFKRQLCDHQMLNWSKKVPWLSFLNNYYGIDDIKPNPVKVWSSKVGGKNDFHLYWNKSTDLAPVSYDLVETTNLNLIFMDYCDTISLWISEGFTTSSQYYYSQPKSFFSGTGNNLNNKLILRDSFSLPSGGLLSFQSYYSTEENYLLTGEIKRDVFYVELADDNKNYWALDSFYGKNKIWTEHRYILPQSNKLWLRFRYKTDGSYSDSGVFVDDIKVFAFSNSRKIVTNHIDTSFYIFNIAQGNYYYLVTPIDAFGNRGFTSNITEVSIKDYCEPYSLPSPFQKDCIIYCDFPVYEKPDLYIYTLSGELVTKIEHNKFNDKTVAWNGRNSVSKEVTCGLYLILLKSNNFQRVGKIVKVK